MRSPARHDRSFELDYPQLLGRYLNYDEAQATVDYLADIRFPVENLMIVGTELRQVERVKGRRTWSTVLLNGGISGLGSGLLVGVMLSLFLNSDTAVLPLMLSGVGLGLAFGMLTAALSYGLSGGRRDFESSYDVVATSYEVLCEQCCIAQARQLLAERPADEGPAAG